MYVRGSQILRKSLRRLNWLETGGGGGGVFSLFLFVLFFHCKKDLWPAKHVHMLRLEVITV